MGLATSFIVLKLLLDSWIDPDPRLGGKHL